MKPQDFIFIIVLLSVLLKRSSRFAVIIGITCLLIAMPLFAKWIFFTAERLVWYAWILFATGVIIIVSKEVRS